MSQAKLGAGPVIAVDPGRGKCGLAVVDREGCVLHRSVVGTEELPAAVSRLLMEHRGPVVVVGNRTGAREVARRLAAAPIGVRAVLVDEHRSSEQGRRRYFEENPPRGWRRLLPVTLQTPPRPYDDYVAVVLAERYLASLRER